MSLSKREKGLLIILALVAFIFLLWHFLYQPLAYQQQCQQTQNELLRRELEGMEARIAQNGDRNKEELEDGEAYQQMLVEIPPGPMIPEVIDFLEMSAREAQVKLLSIHYEEGARGLDSANIGKSADIGLDAQPTKFKIATRGNHFDQLALLLKIENASRIFIISGIKLILVQAEGTSADSANRSLITEDHNNDSSIMSPVPESQRVDPNLSIMEIDFTAFYR